MADDEPAMAPVPIERLAAELRRLYVRLGGDRADTGSATWTRQDPEEWAANIDRFDHELVAACRAVGVDAPRLEVGVGLGARERAALIEALAEAGLDVRHG